MHYLPKCRKFGRLKKGEFGRLEKEAKAGKEQVKSSERTKKEQRNDVPKCPRILREIRKRYERSGSVWPEQSRKLRIYAT